MLLDDEDRDLLDAYLKRIIDGVAARTFSTQAARENLAELISLVADRGDYHSFMRAVVHGGPFE